MDNKQKPCQYFLQPRGCLKGEGCDYSHSPSASSSSRSSRRDFDFAQFPAVAPFAAANLPNSAKPCSFYNSARGCVKDDCEFAHTPNPMAAYMAQMGANLPPGQANPLLMLMSTLLPAMTSMMNGQMPPMAGTGGVPPSMIGKKPKLCDFFTSSGSCRKGDTCEYIHQKNKVCEYFTSSKGCKKGKLCDFIHDDEGRSERSSDRDRDRDPPKKNRVCQFVSTPQGCRKGSGCDFQHPGEDGSSGKMAKESSSSRYHPY